MFEDFKIALLKTVSHYTGSHDKLLAQNVEKLAKIAKNLEDKRAFLFECYKHIQKSPSLDIDNQQVTPDYAFGDVYEVYKRLRSTEKYIKSLENNLVTSLHLDISAIERGLFTALHCIDAMFTSGGFEHLKDVPARMRHDIEDTLVEVQNIRKYLDLSAHQVMENRYPTLERQ